MGWFVAFSTSTLTTGAVPTVTSPGRPTQRQRSPSKASPQAPADLTVGCLAHSEATAHSLAAAVHAALEGLTATSGGTWLRGLRWLNRTENRDAENNLWGVLLVYGASVTF